MRLFVAVELDDATRHAVREQQKLAAKQFGRQSSLRLIDPQQVHLTLVFLGEVRPALVNPLVDSMTQPLVGSASFQLGIGGLGVFPPHGAPRILWLGLTRGTTQLSDLPREAREYVNFLSNQMGVQIGLISTGPERSQTIVVRESALAEWLR